MKQDSPYIRTFVLCLNKAKDEGFVENFQLAGRDVIKSEDQRLYKRDQVHIVNAFRFGDTHDPAEHSVVYMIETSDGKKGTLIDESPASPSFQILTNGRP